MRIATAYVTNGTTGSDYERLLKVFRYSVEKNMPGTPVDVIEIEMGEKMRHHTTCLVANHYKLKAYADYVERVRDDVVLMDCDMIVCGDMSKAFETRPFDVAVTARSASRIPVNAGVVFVRSTDLARDFIRQWADEDEAMYWDEKLHIKWRHVGHGMNQASLAKMMSEKTYAAHLTRLPCAKWNACEENWAKAQEQKPSAIHVKGNLKRIALGEHQMSNNYRKYAYVVDMWRRYEKESTEAGMVPHAGQGDEK